MTRPFCSEKKHFWVGWSSVRYHVKFLLSLYVLVFHNHSPSRLNLFLFQVVRLFGQTCYFDDMPSSSIFLNEEVVLHRRDCLSFRGYPHQAIFRCICWVPSRKQLRIFYWGRTQLGAIFMWSWLLILFLSLVFGTQIANLPDFSCSVDWCFWMLKLILFFREEKVVDFCCLSRLELRFWVFCGLLFDKFGFIVLLFDYQFSNGNWRWHWGNTGLLKCCNSTIASDKRLIQWFCSKFLDRGFFSTRCRWLSCDTCCDNFW